MRQFKKSINFCCILPDIASFYPVADLQDGMVFCHSVLQWYAFLGENSMILGGKFKEEEIPQVCKWVHVVRGFHFCFMFILLSSNRRAKLHITETISNIFEKP